MKSPLNIALVLLVVAVLILAIGYFFLKLRLISVKQLSRVAALVSAGAALWCVSLVDFSLFKLDYGFFDKVIFFFVLWFLGFFLFWAGAVLGVPKTSRKKEFAHSSILSMQFMETMMPTRKPKEHEKPFDISQRPKK